ILEELRGRWLEWVRLLPAGNSGLIEVELSRTWSPWRLMVLSEQPNSYRTILSITPMRPLKVFVEYSVCFGTRQYRSSESQSSKWVRPLRPTRSWKEKASGWLLSQTEAFGMYFE